MGSENRVSSAKKHKLSHQNQPANPLKHFDKTVPLVRDQHTVTEPATGTAEPELMLAFLVRHASSAPPTHPHLQCLSELYETTFLGCHCPPPWTKPQHALETADPWHLAGPAGPGGCAGDPAAGLGSLPETPVSDFELLELGP